MGKSLLISVLFIFHFFVFLFFSIFVSFLGLRYFMVIIVFNFTIYYREFLRLVFFICLMSRLVLYYYQLFFFFFSLYINFLFNQYIHTYIYTIISLITRSTSSAPTSNTFNIHFFRILF